ncbi:hypothetical protein K2173_024387 [Erythroxylum novogranatense]|uniref:Thionin-like protein 2 n=1 Tax=Erythroxylum novogranatense TaxID=1862640 RepID=A0AAV8SU55_9ROSI|nr:hypothetical protein K2173_024387 [Erythroxylum novogranatense]
MAVCAVVLLLTGQATAEPFGECYANCLLHCAISTSKTSLIGCPLKCLKDCIFSSSSLLDGFGVRHSRVHNICTLQCAYPNCTSMTSMDNPREMEVGSCVNNCGKRCSVKKMVNSSP